MAFSLQLLVLLIGLFLFNFYCINYNKWNKVFFVLLAILTFVPVEIQGLISGVAYHESGYFNISLLGYDVLIIFLCILLLQRRIRYISKEKLLSIIVCVVLIFGLRFIIDGADALSNKMFDNYGLPILLAILIVSYMSAEDFEKIVKWFYYFVLINAGVACIEYFVGRSLFFHEYYVETVNWYKTIYVSTQYGVPFRCTAFLGHPLTNGAYYLMAVVYLYNRKNEKSPIRDMIELVILAFAIFTTNSRVDFVVFGVYTVYILIKKKEYMKFIGLVFAAVIVICTIDIGEIVSRLFIRDFNGTSMSVRFSAIKSIFNIPVNTFLLGTGYNNTSSLLEMLKFSTNFEIAYLIILVENGIIGFGLWIRAMLLFYKKEMATSIDGYNYREIINGMLVCLLVVAAGSNSIGDPGTSNYILWILLAFSYVASAKKTELDKVMQ